MPQYVYDCLDCKKQTVIRHGYKETGFQCSHCNSSSIVKNLSTPYNSYKSKKIDTDKKEDGEEVKEAIKNNTEELKQMKKKISNRVYNKK
jgi:DNA-directed RNA polymerase subunit RPC12/RpoP